MCHKPEVITTLVLGEAGENLDFKGGGGVEGDV